MYSTLSMSLSIQAKKSPAKFSYDWTIEVFPAGLTVASVEKNSGSGSVKESDIQ